MLLIFLYSLYLSALLNVLIVVIISQLYRDFCVLVLWVLRSFCLYLYYIIFYFYFYFSRATVSAVLQPCRTCHMLILFFLHVVLYVFLANKWWWCTVSLRLAAVFVFFFIFSWTLCIFYPDSLVSKMAYYESKWFTYILFSIVVTFELY